MARFLRAIGIACLLAGVPGAHAQVRPYIGFVYPAGGQQGTTFDVKLGGQGLEDLTQVAISGTGVTARIVACHRALNPQEMTILNEQAQILRRSGTNAASEMMSETPMMAADTMKAAADGKDRDSAGLGGSNLLSRIRERIANYVNRPASAALAHLVYLQVTIDRDAPAGPRELRLVSAKGISNPMVFHVGQLPEMCRKPMKTSHLQVLGKEGQALRIRPDDEVEDQVQIPCTLNGQIASGEVNRYRFAAKKGQHLVIATQARQLIPYIADAVPGWFQPVLALYDSRGKEVGYDDDYRFRPDPTILFKVPSDGDYVLAIYDAIYRGREDFVYRVTVAEWPFVTSMFPLGAQTNTAPRIQLTGWNLAADEIEGPADMSIPRIVSLCSKRNGLDSSPLPFAVDTLPDANEKEPNNQMASAQKVQLPVIVNGRINRKDDWDVFRFYGRSNQVVVVDVMARRLESPVDSVVKLTDADGNLLGFSDDCEDLGAGVNTHHADSYIRVTLPKTGTYFVHLGDTARNGGPEYGYRLRISAPQPDFALRVTPSSLSLRVRGSGAANVHVIRKDGFTGPIKLTLKDPPKGFSASPTTISGTQSVVRINIKTDLAAASEPVDLTVVGAARIKEQEVVREAVPAEDRMQAFFWRHLVPASDFKVLVFDPRDQPEPKRLPPAQPAKAVSEKPEVAADASAKPKFSKQQVAGRLRQLKRLYEEGLLTDEFYSEKVSECEAVAGQ